MKIKTNTGFTLIEVMIVVVIIGVIAAIALPSYLDYTKQARRADAKTALFAVQLAEEKYRANNPSYGSLTDLSFSDPFISPEGYYSITVVKVDTSGATPSTYTATAAPTTKNNQNTDDCGNFVATSADLYTAGGDDEICWQK
jgi:type IV pilus assembly protein PilE